MADVTVVIPTVWDYLADLVTGVPFWAAMAFMSITTIFTFRVYRRKRGWL